MYVVQMPQKAPWWTVLQPGLVFEKKPYGGKFNAITLIYLHTSLQVLCRHMSLN